MSPLPAPEYFARRDALFSRIEDVSGRTRGSIITELQHRTRGSGSMDAIIDALESMLRDAEQETHDDRQEPQ